MGNKRSKSCRLSLAVHRALLSSPRGLHTQSRGGAGRIHARKLPGRVRANAFSHTYLQVEENKPAGHGSRLHDVSAGLTQQSESPQESPKHSRISETKVSVSRVRLFATSRTVARQTPLFMGFSRQEFWSR